MASCAHLGFVLGLKANSINFEWKGYNDSMPNYVLETVQRICSLNDHDLQHHFNQAKEALLLEWKNAYLKQSYLQANVQQDMFMFHNNFELKNLRALLNVYSFEDFTKQLGNWFKNARFLTYITGNFEHQKAIEIVEKVREHFNVTALPVKQVPDSKTFAIEAGSNHIVECPLEDKKNENSAVRTYFESGLCSDQKGDLVNSVVMNYLSQPFFHDLRTTQ